MPGARSFHRRDTHLRALKKQVEKRVSRVWLRRLCTAQGRWTECGLKSSLGAAVQDLRPRAMRCRSAGGAIRASGSQGCGHRQEKSGSRAPSTLSEVLPPLSPLRFSWLSPSRVLTPNTKLDDYVGFTAVHGSEGERRHRAPEREGAGKGVVDHVARQVFRVVLDPAGKGRRLEVGSERRDPEQQRHPVRVSATSDTQRCVRSTLSAIKHFQTHFSLWTLTTALTGGLRLRGRFPWGNEGSEVEPLALGSLNPWFSETQGWA